MQLQRLMTAASFCATLLIGAQAGANGSQVVTEAGATVAMPSVDAPGETTVFIDSFNANTGKLENVFIEVHAKIDGRWHTKNLAPFARKARYGGAFAVDVSMGDRGSLAEFGIARSRVLTLAPTGLPYVRSSQMSDEVGGVLQLADSRLLALEPSRTWMSDGPAKIAIRIALDGRVLDDENFESTLRGEAQVYVRVSYHYTAFKPVAVAEPATHPDAPHFVARREDALLA